MRAYVSICLLLGVALAHAPAMAQEVESLRREISGMRRQLQTLTDRLEAMESTRQQTTAPRGPQTAAGSAPAGDALAESPPAGVTPGLADLARPRQPFALYERRGMGAPAPHARRGGTLREPPGERRRRGHERRRRPGHA